MEGQAGSRLYHKPLGSIPSPLWTCGVLGLLNGYLGPGLEEFAPLCAVLDEDAGRIQRFALTSDLLRSESVNAPEPPPPEEPVGE